MPIFSRHRESPFFAMSKRPCPFSDSSPLQRKTHVRQKEVDLGVRRDENMKHVYGRTMELLFQGPSQCGTDCLGGDWNPQAGRAEQPASPPVAALLWRPDRCGQATGPLCQGSLEGSALKDSGRVGAGLGQCLQCQGSSLGPPSEACQFCERRLCGSCACLCLLCGGSFCHLCSTLNYDDAEVRVFCLSCTS